ncbi:hypothetical protein HH214_12035 [Mucilaginibacter robiniae]|uniref:Gluconate 2-dehydrogenase subunit 3 family protein n=1 Tax=Mucilaginibacter robiniae TaxID=2728022 RepID=A0A7L5E4C5_9SPHI|nr:hypothetical protein [Mucilaginibacter robiniae]QJD96554.1 hypothetical protein HH214_12035 [Mucilaginibacter robiniae]
MKPFKKLGYYIVVLFLMQTAQGCTNKQHTHVAADTSTIIDQKADINATSSNDEKQFRNTLVKFKSAVKVKNKVAVTAFFYFPLQTAPQWTNDELKSSNIKPQDGLIKQAEFLQYFDDIFTKDAIKLIPASKEDDLSEIDKATPENYYKMLQQVTDKGSTLYELQKQYTQDNGEETSFGFVFGKVGGIYKIISYYRPWPLK